VVLTGGPGAGKTAVLELVRHSFCEHVRVLPESAGIVFGGGFPRGRSVALLQAAQRALFFVQRELETAVGAENPALVLCDRGTIDGGAYWPGEGDLWTSAGTTLTEQFSRYDLVLHLRTPPGGSGYNHANPLRIESAAEAAAIDEKIARVWEKHPRRITVEASPDFMVKARRVLDILQSEVPECCRLTHKAG
jgi:predicted ATPase